MPDEVPIKYRCPVCAKWGRRYYSDVPGTFYHCNPKARRGGPGCGEVFRRLNPACEKMIPVWNEIAELANPNGTCKTVDQRIIDLGFRLVDLMKQEGIHDPFQRSRSQVHYLLNNGYACDCGCGRPSSTEYLYGDIKHKRFHNDVCASIAYQTSYFLTNPGPDLAKFLFKVRGPGCEKCGTTKGPFNLDHIKEVNEGGGMCWVDNFQNLCEPCHKIKSAEYAALRAERKRNEKAEEAAKNDPQLSLF